MPYIDVGLPAHSDTSRFASDWNAGSAEVDDEVRIVVARARECCDG